MEREDFKVNHFVRHKTKGIGKIIEICNCIRYKERGFVEPVIKYGNGDTSWITPNSDLSDYTTMADIPQKLLQDGDIILVDDGYAFKVDKVKNNIIIVYSLEKKLTIIEFDDVERIITQDKFEEESIEIEKE